MVDVNDLEICDRGCLYKKRLEYGCMMRLDKGVERARKIGSCKMFKDSKTTFNNNKATCEK